MSEVTRSAEATTARAAARVAQRRRSPAGGIWGVLLFAATEGALFGALIASYFYLRFNSVAWPPAGIEPPSAALPLALTAALVATTAPMLGAAWAAGRGRRGLVLLLVLAASLLQGGYLAWQIVLVAEDLSKFSPDDTAYGSIYFTLLFVHHAHVAVGLLLNAWVLARLATGLTNYRVLTVRVVAIYWAFVNAVAVAVVATQVSPS
jgi:heme/copper-type cytochrome/quinol oxidase subunit 3